MGNLLFFCERACMMRIPAGALNKISYYDDRTGNPAP